MANEHDTIATEIRLHLNRLGNPDDALFLQRYFKTGPGEYGHGDMFIGVRVPVIRRLLNGYKYLTSSGILPLLVSPVHEERLFAMLALVRIYEKGDEVVREHIYHMYLEHTAFINNWDLVDVSAPRIVGAFLADRSTEPLYRLIASDRLWERRIAVLATFSFIRFNRFSDSLAIAQLSLGDNEDLIHKAVGWMLREVGKRDQLVEEAFLREHCRQMPRTMLRYAIEKFPPELRRRYLDGFPEEVGTEKK
jgi:3-methyladenine DNA glycosylase AlkD